MSMIHDLYKQKSALELELSCLEADDRAFTNGSWPRITDIRSEIHAINKSIGLLEAKEAIDEAAITLGGCLEALQAETNS